MERDVRGEGTEKERERERSLLCCVGQISTEQPGVLWPVHNQIL